MFLGTWQIDDVLTWTVTTHTFATGALTDADAPPDYRVYEDETGTAILTGSMAKLDDANTTGHYSEQVTLSAANGFEVGKSYSIYITAAVASVTGATVRSFQVEAAPATAAALASGVTLAATTHTGAVIPNVTTVGSVTTKTGYELAASYDAAKTAATQASVDDVPTTAELATALAAADDAILVAIGALNNLSSAQAQTAATAALNAYDPPTKTEMDAGFAAGDDAVLAAIALLNNLSSAGAQAAAAAALAAYDVAKVADVGGGGGGSSAADVWTYATRTLTAVTVAGPGTQVDGGAITALRGDSFSVSLTGLGNITARTKLWFTAKRRTGQTDAQAEIQIIEATGLAVIAGSAAAAGNGSLAVTNAATGAVTLALSAVETAKMPPGDMLAWDIQMATAAGVTTLAVGTLTFSADVTLATT